MFDKPEPVSHLLEDLLSRRGWGSFVVEGCHQPSVIRGLIKGQDVTESIEDTEGAEEFQESVDRAFGSIKGFEQHVSRTRNETIRRYAESLKKVRASFSCYPTFTGHRIVEKHARHARSLMGSIQRGGQVHEMASRLLDEAYNDLKVMEKTMPYKVGVQGDILAECKYEDQHDSFIKAFSKKFKVKAERIEYMNEGVSAFYSPEDTKTLQDTIFAEMSAFCFSKKYLITKKGSLADADFGSFGECLSKWSFVYCDSLSKPEKDDE